MIILYSLSGILLPVLFHMLYMQRTVQFSSINILFYMLAPLSYFYRRGASYALMAASWLVAVPVAVYFYRLNISQAVIPLLAFNLLQLGFMQCRKTTDRRRDNLEAGLESEAIKKKNLQEELAKAGSFEKAMKEKEAAMVSLYEVTKKMSASLKFGDIFEVFCAFLKDNFNFRKSDLLILSREGAPAHVDRVYNVWQAGSERAGKDSANYDNLIKLFLTKGRKDIYASRASEPYLFDELGITDMAVDTLTVVPLLTDGELVAILLIENLPREELEKFIILALQLALEIKKVTLFEMVERLAITDSLTGHYVRRYFSGRINEELDRSKSYKFKFSFLMLDIDDFKKCNDTYGHLVGDVVLSEIARLIKESIREIDLAARYGGEEFAVLLPETDQDGAYLVAERIRKKIEENIFRAYDEELKITVSAGVSTYPRNSSDASGIVEKADKALYASKRSGKNIVSVFKK